MDIDNITLGVVSSVAELIDLHDQHFRFHNWSFRGQPRKFGTLVPSFERVFEAKRVGAAQIIERNLINAFREHYTKLHASGEALNGSPSPEEIGADKYLKCLSVMQHYEVPTRLLDWTSSFWTAVYFACASEPGQDAEFWIYHRSIFSDINKKWAVLSEPKPEPQFIGLKGDPLLVELVPNHAGRMRQQFGHHTVCTDVFADHGPLLYDLSTKIDSSSISWGRSFGRLLISSKCKDNALKFLAEEQSITASTIFPDIVGLGRFLRWQLDSLRTMLM